MNELKIFEYKNNKIRTTLSESNEVLFVAVDVCNELGFLDCSSAIRNHVEKDDTLVQRFVDSAGRSNQMNFVTESGLYALVFASRKPEAKEFKQWVTKIVLPSIRKTGSYAINQQFKLPKNYLEALEALVETEKEKMLLEVKIEKNKPKVAFYDDFAESKGLKSFLTFSKLTGIGRNKLMLKLREEHITTKNNLPYQKYVELGYFEVKETLNGAFNYSQTFITPKGVQWLQKILKLESLQQSFNLEEVY